MEEEDEIKVTYTFIQIGIYHRSLRMTLSLVNEEDSNDVISPILKSFLAKDLAEDIGETLLDMIKFNEVSLYKISNDKKLIGFLILNEQMDFDDDDKPFKLLVIDEIWVLPDVDTDDSSLQEIPGEVLKIAETKKIKFIEIVVNEGNMWLNRFLEEQGFLIREIQGRKIVPHPDYVADIMSLIESTLPDVDKLVELSFSKDDENINEFGISTDEIIEYRNEGWIPELVNVYYEVNSKDASKIISETSQIINWDEIQVVFKNIQ